MNNLITKNEVVVDNSSSQKYIVVREENRNVNSMLGSKLHNNNNEYRKTLTHINNENMKNDIKFRNPDFTISDFQNAVKNCKIDLNKSRKDLRYAYFEDGELIADNKKFQNLRIKYKKEANQKFDRTTKDRKNLVEQYTRDKLLENHNIKYSVKSNIYEQNPAGYEQVFAFSNSINNEKITKSEWLQFMINWKDEINKKNGSRLIEADCHFDSEQTIHFHFLFSSVDKEGNYTKKEQIMSKDYGKSLQDLGDKIFNETFKNKKMNYDYTRGKTKTSKFNDHINQNDLVEEQKKQIEVIKTLSSDIKKSFDVDNLEDSISNLKALTTVYKDNKVAKNLFINLRKEFEKAKSGVDEAIKFSQKTNLRFSKLKTYEDLFSLIQEDPKVFAYINSKQKYKKHLSKLGFEDIPKWKDNIQPSKQIEQHLSSSIVATKPRVKPKYR